MPFFWKIGKYLIYEYPEADAYWMVIDRDGEGMEISREKLEEEMDRIYRENF